MTEPKELTELWEEYQEKPILFIEDWLGIPITPFPDDCPPPGWNGAVLPLTHYQVDIINAIGKYKKVAVKSANGVGKTFTAALIALMLFYTKQALGITTAPTFRQVRRLLWGEIHKIKGYADKWLREEGRPPLGGKLKQVSLDCGGKWYMEGFSTDKPDSFQGAHEENLFLILDEACGIDREIYEAAEGILTSENSYVLLIGNPTDPTSAFFEKFEPNSGFHKITISAYDTPNVKHQKIIYPALCAPGWPEEKRIQWGEESPMYQARVQGEFPLEGADVLIPLRYTMAALQKWELLKEDADEKDKYKLNSLACDVARKGDDRTIIGMKFIKDEEDDENREVIFTVVEDCVKLKTTETTGLLKEWCDRIKDRDIPIKVDDIGVGGGVVDQLEDDGYNVIPVNVAESPTEVEGDIIFYNLRAQYYWRLREDFIDGKVAISDEELASELSKITWKTSRTRKIQIEAKEDIKARIGKSPDKADCLALSYAEYPAPTVRWLTL
jgi:hypothetical protein